MVVDKFKDRKISKERLSVLLASSANIEKFKPLEISKDKRPRCFETVNPENILFLWYANTKGRMTETIFSECVNIIYE